MQHDKSPLALHIFYENMARDCSDMPSWNVECGEQISEDDTALPSWARLFDIYGTVLSR